MGPAAADDVHRTVGYPCVVKPSKQGSSVGLTLVKRGPDLAAAVKLAEQFDDEVMIEQFIPGPELTVGILGDEALPVIEIRSKHEMFDYECKYQPGMAEEICPAPIAQVGGLQPDRLPRGRGRRPLLSRGQHAARHDRQ
jgi:D-alanine-D-alanine ligase